MKWTRIARAGAWSWLFGITLLQLALSVVSEPYIPLRSDQYQLQYSDADGRGAEGLKDVQVSVWHDVLTPIPILPTSIISFVALFALAATGAQAPGSRSPSPG